MRSTRFAAALAVLLIVGMAGVAWGANGNPLILGRENKAGGTTSLVNKSVNVTFSAGGQTGGVVGYTTFDGIGVWGQAHQFHDGIGVEASAHPHNIALAVNGLATIEGRAIFLGQTVFEFGGRATIPAGSRAITVPIQQGAIDLATVALANLQDHRAGVYVEAAVTDESASTLRIYLNARVSKDTRVAWFMFDALDASTRQALQARVKRAEARARAGLPEGSALGG